MFNRNDRSCSFGAEAKHFLSIHTSISLIRTLCSHSEHANVVACDLDYELYVYRDRPTESKAKRPHRTEAIERQNERVCVPVCICVYYACVQHTLRICALTDH